MDIREELYNTNRIEKISWSRAATIAKIKNGTKFWDAGEVEPFPSMSNASMARVMEAIIKTGTKLHCSHTLDASYSRASVVYRVEIPVGLESTFEQISKTKLTEPPVVNVN